MGYIHICSVLSSVLYIVHNIVCGVQCHSGPSYVHNSLPVIVHCVTTRNITMDNVDDPFYHYMYNVYAIMYIATIQSLSLFSLSPPPPPPPPTPQGIGDSGQGFANAILFVLFTPKVRRYFLRLLFCHCLWHKSQNQVNIQSNAKIYYGTAPSNSDYRTEDSIEPPTVCSVSEGMILNKDK